MHPCGSGHVLVDDLVHAGSGVGDRQAERVGDGCECGVGGGDVEWHVTAQEELGVEEAEREVGVGDGGLRATTPIGGRARSGTGGLGLQSAER